MDKFTTRVPDLHKIMLTKDHNKEKVLRLIYCHNAYDVPLEHLFSGNEFSELVSVLTKRKAIGQFVCVPFNGTPRTNDRLTIRRLDECTFEFELRSKYLAHDELTRVEILFKSCMSKEEYKNFVKAVEDNVEYEY